MRTWLMSTLAVLTAMAGAAAPLSLTFFPAGVSVSGLTPGSRAVFVGQLSEGMGYYPRLTNLVQVVVDGDSDGSALLPFETGVPPRSLWFVQDLATGETVTGTPPGRFSASVQPFPSDWLKRENAGQLRRLEAKLPLAEFIWIRPGTGVWVTSAGDGGSSDRGQQQDGKTVLDCADFSPLPGFDTPPPPHFKRGDTLLAIQPWTFDLYWSTLASE